MSNKNHIVSARVKPGAQPDEVKTSVVRYVLENCTLEEVVRRVPRSVTDAFFTDWLAFDQARCQTRVRHNDYEAVQTNMGS